MRKRTPNYQVELESANLPLSLFESKFGEFNRDEIKRSATLRFYLLTWCRSTPTKIGRYDHFHQQCINVRVKAGEYVR